MTSAVVADDAPLIREAISGVLRAGGVEVLAEVGDAAALVDATRDRHPDVVVVDVRMPPGHRLEGLEAAVQLRADHPRLGILLLSQHVEPRYLSRLLVRGAGWTGYLLKERAAGADAFVAAVEAVAAGGCSFDPEVVAALVSSARAHDALDALSPREREVLQLMAEGWSNATIAGRLRMADKTVESHVRRVFQRLDVPDDPDINRRVTAVLSYLRSVPPDGSRVSPRER